MPNPSPAPLENSISQTTLVSRSLFGGALMGLANLVPGISGGTMLLAAGVYPSFIEALSEVTRFKFRFRSLLVLGCIGLAAVVGILLLAGTLKGMVVHQRWIMYSLFIGLTLGGVPIVWKMAKPATPSLIVAAVLSFAAMVGLAWLQHQGVMGSGSSNYVTLFSAGLAGASAMILPGLSGGYLLLLMGQYVPILSAIDQFKDALKAGDMAAALDPALTVLVPVGLGVVAGIVIVGNLLKWLLERYQKPTLGILLGLLIGSVVGLWPFQQGVTPKIGDTIKGQVVTAETIESIEEDDWLTEFFRPSSTQLAGSIALIALGLAVTQGISLIGKEK